MGSLAPSSRLGSRRGFETNQWVPVVCWLDLNSMHEYDSFGSLRLVADCEVLVIGLG